MYVDLDPTPLDPVYREADRLSLSPGMQRRTASAELPLSNRSKRLLGRTIHFKHSIHVHAAARTRGAAARSAMYTVNVHDCTCVQTNVQYGTIQIDLSIVAYALRIYAAHHICPYHQPHMPSISSHMPSISSHMPGVTKGIRPYALCQLITSQI